MKSTLPQILCSLVLLGGCALLAQDGPKVGDIERDAAERAAQLERIYTVATNRSLAHGDFAARIAAVAELSSLTNTSTAKVTTSESTQEPPRRPAARWVAGPDQILVAENSFVRASVADNLSLPGALTVTLPSHAGSREVRSSIVGLAFCEPGENGRTVLIAQVKPTKAQLLANDRNQSSTNPGPRRAATSARGLAWGAVRFGPNAGRTGLGRADKQLIETAYCGSRTCQWVSEQTG